MADSHAAAALTSNTMSMLNLREKCVMQREIAKVHPLTTSKQCQAPQSSIRPAHECHVAFAAAGRLHQCLFLRKRALRRVR